MGRTLKQVATDVFVRIYNRDFSDKDPINWRMVASHVISAKADVLKRYTDNGGSIPADAYDAEVLDVTHNPDRFWQARIPADFSDMDGGFFIALPGAYGDGKVSAIPETQVSAYARVPSQGQIYAWRHLDHIEFMRDPGPKVIFRYLATQGAADIHEDTEFKIADYLLQTVMDEAYKRLVPPSQKEKDNRATGNPGQKP